MTEETSKSVQWDKATRWPSQGSVSVAESRCHMGCKQSSEGRGGTEAWRMTPVEAQNVKRGTTNLGKLEFALPNLVQESGGQ